MSATLLSRERGCVITCNNGVLEGHDDCDARHFTANVRIRVNRIEATKLGWIRGGGDGRRRLDFCPGHADEERARVKVEKAAKAAAKKVRAEAMKAARTGEATPRKKRKAIAAEVSA